MKKIFFAFAMAILGLGSMVQAQNMRPEQTEYWHNQPPVVTPGDFVKPPSDATILFDGTDLSKWTSESDNSPATWEVKDGAMTVGKGGIRTKEYFGDCQLHIEFRSPSVVRGTSQGRGNSGIFLQSTYEVQVLDCYDNATYFSNGVTGSIYKQSAPLVNACKKPGEWQTYDIVWTAPRFGTDGKLDAPATATIFLNGVLVQNHFVLKGDTPYTGFPTYKPHGRLPLSLQDHGNPVSYRNIWIRNL